MKNRLLSITLGLSLLGSASNLPALAENFLEPEVEPQNFTIPKSSSITAIVPRELIVAIDKEQMQDYPLTLFLAQPLMDNQGNILAPINSPLAAHLKFTKDGVQIFTDSLVIKGYQISLQASSSIIPSITVTRTDGTHKSKKVGSTVGRIIGGFWGGANGAETDAFDEGAMIGSGLGNLIGVLSPEKSQMIHIPQGSVYILTLQTPVNLVTTTDIRQTITTHDLEGF